VTFTQPAAGPVLLCGAFGQRNPGDEALLAAFHRALEGTPVIATSADPAQTEWAHKIGAVDSHSPRAVSRAVGESAAVVFAGGTVFKELPPESGRGRRELLRNALAVATLARARGRGPLLVGVGAGELSDRASQTLARGLARQAELLILRDDASARALAKLGVPAPLRVGADAAWTLVDLVPHPVAESDRGDRVVVVLSRWSTGIDQIPTLAAALQRLLSLGISIGIQPWQIGGPGIDDLDLAAHLAGHLTGPVQVIAPPGDLLTATRTFRRARLVISARFHGLVAAAAANTTSLALGSAEPKQSELSARLGQPAVSMAGSEQELAAAMLSAVDIAPPAASVVRAEVAAAEAGFGLLRLMLAEGAASGEDVSGLRLESVG
jgi:polysaccharide pyruvyl transferase WcaK-like protein